jgi:acyl-homoserine lactone acylase PvdQ
VAAPRTAGGASIALIDPHLSWEPQNRFYEARVRGGALSFYGFSVIGTPLMALGHTDVYSLALTTGGPDCADVYEEKIHPDDPLRYEYDGEWRPIEVEEARIVVRAGDSTRIENLRIERTHHGPIVERRGDRAFAVRTGYDREIGIGEQWLRMLAARDLDAFVEALRANQSLPQNVLYADVAGDVYYLRAGRVPRRPAGYAWSAPVPGWTPDTEWLGVHPLEDLVQIRNPEAGYLQNCNVSPDVMMPDSPLTPDRYPDVIYNSPPERLNSRGRRALALLAASPALTVQDARRIANDTYAVESEAWLAVLRAAAAAQPEASPDLRAPIRLLLGWNGHVDTGSRAATLFRFWMRAALDGGSGVPPAKIREGEPLAAEERASLLRALASAADALSEMHGGFRVPWGRLHRIGRGERSWPVAGCRADGISTLRSVRYDGPDDRGVFHASGGQICPTVVVLDRAGIRSYTAAPLGQSGDLDSPHYDDQARKLFSRGKLRPTEYSRSGPPRHVTSKRTLAVRSLAETGGRRPDGQGL